MATPSGSVDFVVFAIFLVFSMSGDCVDCGSEPTSVERSQCRCRSSVLRASTASSDTLSTIPRRPAHGTRNSGCAQTPKRNGSYSSAAVQTLGNEAGPSLRSVFGAGCPLGVIPSAARDLCSTASWIPRCAWDDTLVERGLLFLIVERSDEAIRSARHLAAWRRSLFAGCPDASTMLESGAYSPA